MRYWPHPAEIPLIRAPTEIPHNVMNIFTDGSKIAGNVGAAVIIKDDIVLHQPKLINGKVEFVKNVFEKLVQENVLTAVRVKVKVTLKQATSIGIALLFL